MTVANSEVAADAQPKSGGSDRRIRIFILIATIICLSSIMANIVAFNFAVLCMPGIAKDNQTIPTGYTREERTWLFSAVAIGALVSVVPTSAAIARFGCKLTFFAAGMVSFFSTFLIPLGASNMNHFLLLRFLQGISFASLMPTVGSVTSRWATLKQNGLFISVLTTFAQISGVVSMPVAGELCESSFGWSSIYYCHAIFCGCVFILWFFIYTDNPEDHALVTKQELIAIQDGKSAEQGHEAVPYRAILTTPSIWGVWIGALGDLIAIQLIHTFSPIYIRTVLKYSVHKTGFAAALPVLVQFIIKVTAGHSSDQIHGVSETTKLRIFNSIALGASAIFMAALAFVQEGQKTLGIVLITATTGIFGFNGGGFNKCATLVSRQHSHFVLAFIQFLWCLSMLVCPILVGFLLPTGASSEWALVYIIHALILFASNVIFCLLATAKPAPWTNAESASTSRRNTPFFS